MNTSFPRWLAWMTLLLSVMLSRPVLAHGEVHDQITALTRELEQMSQNFVGIALRKQRALLLHRRGELYRADGDFAAALQDYAAAQHDDAGLLVIKLSRGRVLLEQGEATQASDQLESFLRAQPKHVEGHVLLARARQRLGDYRRAEVHFARALNIASDPTPDLFLERAANLVTLEQRQQAIAVLDRGIERLGPLFVLQDLALQIASEGRNYDDALRRLEEMIGAQPNHLGLVVQKFTLLRQSCEVAKAEAVHGEILRRHANLTAVQQQRVSTRKMMQEFETIAAKSVSCANLPAKG